MRKMVDSQRLKQQLTVLYYSVSDTIHSEKMVGRVQGCGTALESAGEALMKRQSVPAIGKLLLVAAEELQQLSILIGQLSEIDEGKTAAQRCNYAADRMSLAGNSLLPTDSSTTKVSGKSWLKGGA